jgi:hypothetical protein
MSIAAHRPQFIGALADALLDFVAHGNLRSDFVKSRFISAGAWLTRG